MSAQILSQVMRSMVRSSDITVYDVARGVELRRIAAHTGHVLTVNFLPDGKHFVSSAADASVQYSSVDQDRPLGYYRIDVIQETNPVIGADGRFFAVFAGSIWHIVTIQPGQMQDYATLPGDLRLNGFSFQPDGKHFLINDPWGRRIVPLDALAAAIDAAPRELTPPERGRWEVGTVEERDAAKLAYVQKHLSIHTLNRLAGDAANGILLPSSKI